MGWTLIEPTIVSKYGTGTTSYKIAFFVYFITFIPIGLGIKEIVDILYYDEVNAEFKDMPDDYGLNNVLNGPRYDFG